MYGLMRSNNPFRIIMAVYSVGEGMEDVFGSCSYCPANAKSGYFTDSENTDMHSVHDVERFGDPSLDSQWTKPL